MDRRRTPDAVRRPNAAGAEGRAGDTRRAGGGAGLPRPAGVAADGGGEGAAGPAGGAVGAGDPVRRLVRPARETTRAGNDRPARQIALGGETQVVARPDRNRS